VLDHSQHLRHNKGFTLTELMVALVVGSLVSLATVTAFSTQSGLISQQTLRMQAAADGQETYDAVSRMLRHAIKNSICISSLNSAVFTRIDFTLPPGMRIWPNNVGSFSDNRVRLEWNNNTKQLSYANATPNLLLPAQCDDPNPLNNMTPLMGATTKANTQITQFDLSDNNNGSFRLRMTVRAGTIASTASLFGHDILPRN